jgi:hypothetical protein
MTCTTTNLLVDSHDVFNSMLNEQAPTTLFFFWKWNFLCFIQWITVRQYYCMMTPKSVMLNLKITIINASKSKRHFLSPTLCRFLFKQFRLWRSLSRESEIFLPFISTFIYLIISTLDNNKKNTIFAQPENFCIF